MYFYFLFILLILLNSNTSGGNCCKSTGLPVYNGKAHDFLQSLRSNIGKGFALLFFVQSFVLSADGCRYEIPPNSPIKKSPVYHASYEKLF